MTLLEIQKHLDKIIEILNLAKQYSYDSKAILILDTAEKDIVVRRNKFFNRTQKAFWELSIIEIHKVYGGANDSYKLDKLFKTLINNHKGSEWENLITLNDLTIFDEKLKDDEFIEPIKQLKELRNQHFAHCDKKPKNSVYDIKLYYPSLNKLFDLTEVICFKLKSKLFDIESTKFEIDTMSVDDLINSKVESIRIKGIKSI